MQHTVCAAGDAILIENLPDEYSVEELSNLIQKADVRLFNLENVLSDENIYGSSYCGGTWLMAKPERLDDLLRFGFNGCAIANNHTMDYSYDGLFHTIAALKERRLPFCGAGKNLKEAAAHMEINTKQGRVAVFSVCSTFSDAARAGDDGATVIGRPGLNPLRFQTVYQITPGHMQALQEISKGTHIDGRRNHARAEGFTPPVPDGTFGFGEYLFEESAAEGKRSAPNQADLRRMAEGIKRAKETCELVIVYVHSHEIKRDTNDEPDDFLVQFSHACIDAGANAVIGSGTHQLKAVEIYKRRPIFYSLGNFIFQSDLLFCLPQDFEEKYKTPEGLSPKEQIAWRSKNGTIGLHSDKINFRSFLPFMTFEDGDLKNMSLYPISLNMKSGLPALASPDETEEIFEYMKKRNEPFGTRLLLEGGEIVWETEK